MNQPLDRMAADAPDADEPGPVLTPPRQQHLVVESRVEDRWKVVFCSTLDDLDGALDTARGLNADPDVDEVCLSLETAGSQGREMRREVIRFGGESRRPAARKSDPVPDADSYSHTIDDAGRSAILPAVKAPDFSIDEEILDALEPRPAVRMLHAVHEDPAPAGGETGSAVRGTDDGPSEAEARAAARAIVNSLYGRGDGDRNGGGAAEVPDLLGMSGGETIAASIPERNGSEAAEPEAGKPDPANNETSPALAAGGSWTDDLERLAGRTRPAAAKLEAGDCRTDAAARLERPLVGDASGVAAKTFIVAGTLAMMVLGGALAELLALDITTAAEAGTDAALSASRIVASGY